MKIAILGSSFDPPHLGHLIIARQVKKILELDQVWLMPPFLHPFSKKVSAVKHRLAMTKLLEEDDIKTSNFEIKQHKVNYSLETLNLLSKLFPRDKFYWIIGSDQLKTFKKWRDWQEIIKKYHLVIFPRQSKDITNKVKKFLNLKTIPKNIIVLNTKNLTLTNISSTLIRKIVREKKSIKNLVPEKVEEYIKKNNLYA